MTHILEKALIYVRDEIKYFWMNFKRNRMYRTKAKYFNKAKKLAELKHSSDKKRYYVFEDPRGGFMVLNNWELDRVVQHTKLDLNFMNALYKTK